MYSFCHLEGDENHPDAQNQKIIHNTGKTHFHFILIICLLLVFTGVLKVVLQLIFTIYSIAKKDTYILMHRRVVVIKCFQFLRYLARWLTQQWFKNSYYNLNSFRKNSTVKECLFETLDSLLDVYDLDGRWDKKNVTPHMASLLTEVRTYLYKYSCFMQNSKNLPVLPIIVH